MSYESEPIEATVAELKPRMKNITISFKVMEKGEEREVISRRSGETNRVLDAVVGDSSGCVTVPLWNDTIEQVEVGSTYNLKNGYTGLFRGHLRLNIGRYGELEASEEGIEEVNVENDLSAEEHEQEYRRRDYGGRGGGYGGRGGYGNRGGYDRRDRRGRRRRY